jgi:hypothetical protein
MQLNTVANIKVILKRFVKIVVSLQKYYFGHCPSCNVLDTHEVSEVGANPEMSWYIKYTLGNGECPT